METKFDFSNCECYEDIVSVIEQSLEDDGPVECSEEQAEKWFRFAGKEGEVASRVIVNTQVSVYDSLLEFEQTYDVIVKEHFTAPNAVDSVYSYDIS